MIQEPALPGAANPVAQEQRGSLRTRVRLVLRSQRTFALGLVIVPIVLFLTVFGPLLAPYPPQTATPSVELPPSPRHLFGTDANGFDVFSRVVAAPRVDISIALGVMVLAFAIGSLLGLVVGYTTTTLGELFMRGIELVQAFPLFVLAVITVVMLGGSTLDLIGVAAVLNVPIYVKLVRTQVLSVRKLTFVEAARAAGLTENQIALRHVLPNSISSALAQAPITIGYTVLLTAGLSFIGAGIKPPTAEWGSMIASGTEGIVIGQWWTSVFPGAALALSAFGFSVLGEFLHNLTGDRW
jgi:peptide/nickel transport system permease protein